MKVFIDTNIFLDYLERRPCYKEALALFRLSAKEEISLFLSDLTIANSKYITRRTISLNEYYAILKRLRKYFHIVPVSSQAVDNALSIEATDFEDALQYFAAELANADCIVTRNIKDFDFATRIEIIEPKDFIEKYYPEELV